jgi:hypothetical protein
MHERQKNVVMAGHSCPKDGVASASLRPAIHAFAGRTNDVDARAFAAPKGLRPRRRVKPGHDELRALQRRRSPLTRFLISLPAALVSFFISSLPAYADLKLCNRMSYVVEAAIGIDDKSATATRGWFRIDPAACRVVLQGALTADRILLNARALGVYGASPPPASAAATRRLLPSPRSRRRAPTTAIWSPISPRIPNMTTSRRGLPASSGCW